MLRLKNTDLKMTKIERKSQDTWDVSYSLTGETTIYKNNSYVCNVKTKFEKAIYVYLCSSLRALNFASVPLKVGYYKNSDEFVHEKNHPIQKLLNKPNSYYSKHNFMQFLMLSKILAGKGIAVILTGKIDKEPVGIFYLRPDRCQFNIEDSKIVSVEYEEAPGKKILYHYEQLLITKYIDLLNLNDGKSPLLSGEATIEISNEIDTWNRIFFKNAARPDGAFKTSATLSDPQYERLKNQIDNDYIGVNNAHKPLLLEEGLEWQEIGKTHKDLDFQYLQGKIREDICALLQVPTELIIPTAATYNNISTARKILWENTIIPDILDYVDELNNKLVPMFKNSKNLVIIPDFSKISALKEDETPIIDNLVKLVNADVITLNTAATKLGYPQVTTEQLTRSEFLKALNQKYPSFSMGAFSDLENEEETTKNINTKLEMKKVKEITIPSGVIKSSEFNKSISNLLTGVANYSAEQWLKALDKTVKYNPQNKNLIKFIKKKTGELISNVDRTTIKDLRKEMTKSAELGETIDEMKERIEKLFDGYSKGRVGVIARTESSHAANYGVYNAYKDTDIVEKKVWITQRDELVRDSHEVLDGEAIDLDENFKTGDGNETEFPGDTGVASDDIECRCFLASILKDAFKSLIIDKSEFEFDTLENKKIYWDKKDKLMKSFEPNFEKIFLKYFEVQKEKVLNYLD